MWIVRWSWFGLALLGVACALDRLGSGASNEAGGTAGVDSGAGSGGIGGVSGAGGTAGAWTGGTAGSAGVAGASGAAGAGGTAAAGGVAGSAGSGPDLCDQLCTDPNATCSAQATCDCKAGFLNTDSDGEPKTATCQDMAVTSVKLEVGIGHARSGHLTVKLRGPDGTVLTLMSRPGALEPADNGTGTQPGAAGGMDKGYPVTFEDGAATPGENMGADFVGGTVCKNGAQICSFAPDAGIGGSTSFAAAFAGKFAVGDWTLCVGDSVVGGGGKLEFWTLSLDLVSGPTILPSALGLSVVVTDDGYDGNLQTMGCHTLTVGP